MGPLTLIGTIIGILAAIAGIIAAIVQVREYREKRREKPEGPGKEDQPLTPPGAPPIPHNLPPRSEFIGREAEKAHVHEALRSRSYLISVDGIGGIGKTALALEVAHECLRASKGERPTDGAATFNGFIWTTAKDQDLTLNALLDTIARTLEYPGIAQQPLEDKRVAVRKLLQAKPYLLIVDNFETITDEGVRDFLLELPEPAKTLLTTREQKLRQVRAISLKGLTESEASALIRNEGRRLGLVSLEQAEDRMLLHLYQATGGTPLAIKWAVGQIKQKGQSLDTVLASLHEARGSVFDNIFTRSWGLLSAGARQVLIVMPIFATSASRAGIEAASDVHHFVLDEALGQLVEMSLVDATDELDLARRSYSIHPLTRAYAENRLQSVPQSKQDDARRRMVQYFCKYAEQYGKDLRELGKYTEDSVDQLEKDLPNILTAFDYGYHLEEWERIIQLLDAVSDFLDRRGYWQERVRLSEKALEAAERYRDYEEQGRIAIYHRGWTLLLQEKYEEAKQLIEEGLAVAREHDHPDQVALALRNLGVIALEEKRYTEAYDKCEDSLTWWTKADPTKSGLNPRRGEAMTLGTLGNIAWELGEYDRAQYYYVRQQVAYQELNDSYGLSVAYANLATCAVCRGRPLEAVRSCRMSLEEFRATGRTDSSGYMLWLLKKQAQREGNFPGRRLLLLDKSVTFDQYGRKPIKVYSYYFLHAFAQKLKLAVA